MSPLPPLNFTGGAGGAATAGTQGGATVPWSNAFGSFQVGGRGNSGSGGTASAAATPSPMLWLILGGAALLGLVVFFAFRRK